jgi:putative ABC transport system permease protein
MIDVSGEWIFWICKSTKHLTSKIFFMLKNYFIIAWRNVSRQKVYTAINVLGLALGICACIVIYLITSYDLSFDKFHPDGDRIYRIVGEGQRGSSEKQFLNSPNEDVAGFQHEIPGFETAVAVHLYGANVTIEGNPAKKFGGKIDGTWTSASIFTSSPYFEIFRYEWLAGNSKTALSEPYAVVLTEKNAKKYFGEISAGEMIGKKVIYDDSLQVTVSGIVKDWDQKTDFGYTDFISIATATHSFLKNRIPTEDWNSLSQHRSMAFIKLAKTTTPAQVNERFTRFINEHIKLPNDGSKLSMWLQPLADIHFTNEYHRGDDGDNFRKAYMPALYALMGVALFILIIAMVNFINLSTAQSIQRAKEIGVRKVLGGNRSNIMFQFFTETGVIAFFAVLVSALLVNPVLYLFRDYVPASVSFHAFDSSSIVFLLIILITTTLLAGFYPSKVLASYLPVTSLNGKAVPAGAEKINLRKALIVFQFTVSLVFIIGALIIGKQINFMNKADKGFNTDAIITLNNWNDHEGKLKVLAQQIKIIPGVTQVIRQGTSPMGFAQNIDNYTNKQHNTTADQVLAEIGNEDFIPFYQMRLLAGRNMLHSDSLTEVVINVAYSKALGFIHPRDAIGKMLYYQAEKAVPIVGVVADFHQSSFHDPIKPAVIENVPERLSSIAIKLAAGEKNIDGVKPVIAKIEKEWKAIFPETPFNYSFLNDSISSLFGQEEKTAWLVNVAMGITIFISCMGLFGLGMFTARKRTKEIGIRKVLGASAARIAAMLSKDFITLVLGAVVIASPIAWYFSNQWLQDFAYRTAISWWIFAAAGLAAVVIAVITISFQAAKAAFQNPVKSLRTE